MGIDAWTAEKPNASGWYWTRARPNAMATILYFDGRSFGRMDKKLATTFREYVGPLSPDSYQRGRVAALGEVERYMAMRLRLAEASLAAEILAGNEVKQGRERAAIAELHGMQRHVSDIKEYNAQRAQGGVGDDLFILP